MIRSNASHRNFSRETREISRARDVIPDFPLPPLLLRLEENSLSNLGSSDAVLPILVADAIIGSPSPRFEY